MTGTMRLHKLLARAGVASLRESERLIAEGRVTVNGATAQAVGASASEDDEIMVDGVLVGRHSVKRHVMLHKPVGVVSTANDERDRLTVTSLVRAEERLYPVGRLDQDSEGLMLLTNDGELAERVMHPRYGVHKEYLVEVAGFVTDADMARLRNGVVLEDGPSRPISARLVERAGRRSRLVVVLGEGRKRQVRRTMEALGYTVQRLLRVALGPLQLGELAPGASRNLTPSEISALRAAAGLPAEKSHK